MDGSKETELYTVQNPGRRSLYGRWFTHCRGASDPPILCSKANGSPPTVRMVETLAGVNQNQC
ncbi:hypothetical protein LINGRAHAP2_LOCUS5873 [Linum grandiflorum]